MSRRFLIVELADIGDLILSTPALAALRDAHPDAHIALLTTAHSAPVLPAGLVDELILFDKHIFDSPKALIKPANLRKALTLAIHLRRGRYDTAIFFHHFTTRFGTLKFAALAWSADSVNRIGLDNGHGFFLTHRLPDGGFGAKHQAQYWLDLVGLAGAKSAPRPTQVKVGATYQVAPTDKPIVAIHAGSGGYSLARRWEAEKFAAVADRLVAECGAQILLVGTKDDNAAAVKAAMKSDALDLSGQTSLAELAAVLKSCDLFIGADSGVIHVASGVGVPMITIFGPSNADAWSPWTPEGTSVVVRSAPECSPCSYVGHGIGLREGCAARTCMRMVTADQVFEAAKNILDAPSTPNPLSHAMRMPQQAGEKGDNAPLPVYLGEGHDALASGVRGTKRIEILGLPVSAITYPEWLDLIDQWIASDQAHHVCTINPEMIMIARQDANFHNILSRADLTVPDGIGLLWAAKHLGQPLPQRVTGSDGVPLIAAEAAKRGWKLYLLGAAPGVADQAAQVLRARHPDLQIVGVYSGSPAPDEEDAIVERVNAAHADILFVAYGAPNQDKWIARNLPRLNVKMAAGIGGSLDFVAGVIPRAPQTFQRFGLEWLYRLYLQPWRILRMMRLPRFVLAVLMRGSRA